MLSELQAAGILDGDLKTWRGFVRNLPTATLELLRWCDEHPRVTRAVDPVALVDWQHRRAVS